LRSKAGATVRKPATNAHVPCKINNPLKRDANFHDNAASFLSYQ